MLRQILDPKIGSHLLSSVRSIYIRAYELKLRYEFFCLYRRADPWKSFAEDETLRFAETNRFIQEMTGPVEHLLEIGCGEGIQTKEFFKVAKHVHALDLNHQAIRRAARYEPRATYELSSFHLYRPSGLRHFDLVTACEFIYYQPDITHALQQLESLAPCRVISFYDAFLERLKPHIDRIPNAVWRTVEFEQSKWHLVYWEDLPREP